MIRTFAALAFLLIAGPALGQARDAPEDDLTPGVARSDITDAQIRSTAWGKDRRHVTPAMKAEVFRRYRVTGVHDPSAGKPRAEVDHRVPRSCGGADDVDNLWVQAAPSWQEKDEYEAWAARQVKAGKLTVEQCQAMFSAPADWRIGFEAIFHRKPERYILGCCAIVGACCGGTRRGETLQQPRDAKEPPCSVRGSAAATGSGARSLLQSTSPRPAASFLTHQPAFS